MNHRRKRPRRQVRCHLCTPRRWGNTKSKMEAGPSRQEKHARLAEREQRRGD